MKSCFIAGPLRGKVRGCDPWGNIQTIALSEGNGRKGIAAPRQGHGQIQERCVTSPLGEPAPCRKALSRKSNF